MDLYAENILDHFRNPRKSGLLPHSTVLQKEDNPSCGDTLEVSMQIEDGVIREVGWEGTGCAISQASMSLLAEEVEGKNVGDVLKMTTEDIRNFLGVPIGLRRAKCAFMSLHCVQQALRQIP